MKWTDHLLRATIIDPNQGGRMPEDKDKNNVVYLHRKPGFYKKGPLKFGLYLGTLEEIEEKAEEAKGLKPVPPEDESA